MKKFLFLSAAVFLLCLCGCSLFREKPEKLVLSIDSNYRIVLPDRSAAWGCKAGLEKTAKLLQRSLKYAVGREFPVVYEKQVRNAPGKSIYLGDTEALRKLGVDLKKMGTYDAFFGEEEGDIFIAGPDKQGWRSKAPSSSALGTLRGVVIFAERYLQTKFLYPGEWGREYAKKPGKVVLKTGIREYLKAPLIFATGGNRVDPFYDAAINNNGEGMFRTYGGHSYYNAVPFKKYFKDHPEYFALLHGKRTGLNNHLCISNPKVQDLIYAEALKCLDAGAEVVQVAQTDGYQPCECAKCKAYGNTNDPGEKIWILHRSLAERLMKDRPGKKMHFLCYPPNSEPPKTFKEFPPNVIIELCRHDFSNIPEEWKNVKVPGGFTVYLYNWGSYQTLGYTPKRTPAFAQKQVSDLKRMGTCGIYRCGFGENMGLEAPTYYVYGKLLNDHTQNPEKLFMEFCDAAFQECAPAMKMFFSKLYERLDLYMMTNDKMNRHGGRAINMIYTADLLQDLEQKLSFAERQAKSEKVKMRLRWARAEFDYAKNLSHCMAFADIYKRFPTQGNFDQLAALLEKRNAMVKKIVGYAKAKKMSEKFIPEWSEATLLRDGYTTTLLQINGRLGGSIYTPLTWNIDFLRKNHILPGSKIMRAAAKAAQGSVGIDFDKDAWSNAAWNEIRGMRLNKIKYTAKFKCVYDKENIYFAIRGKVEPGKKYVNLGRDGAIWSQDCSEVFIDPTGSGERFFQFMANPVQGSVLEQAMGLITDPLHPDYGKPVRSWNGAWRVAHNLKGDQWDVLFTIPFKTLLTGTPAKGDVWKLNVGREMYSKVPGSRKESNEVQELALWSPNMETASFVEPSAFGELKFE